MCRKRVFGCIQLHKSVASSGGKISLLLLVPLSPTTMGSICLWNSKLFYVCLIWGLDCMPIKLHKSVVRSSSKISLLLLVLLSPTTNNTMHFWSRKLLSETWPVYLSSISIHLLSISILIIILSILIFKYWYWYFLFQNVLKYWHFSINFLISISIFYLFLKLS